MTCVDLVMVVRPADEGAGLSRHGGRASIAHLADCRAAGSVVPGAAGWPDGRLAGAAGCAAASSGGMLADAPRAEESRWWRRCN